MNQAVAIAAIRMVAAVVATAAAMALHGCVTSHRQPASTDREAPDLIAIVGATVVNPESGDRPVPMTVLIAGRKILALQDDSLPLPSGVHRIEARGLYLMPGLWDMHVHLGMAGDERAWREIYLPLFVVHGVTSIRDMCGGCRIDDGREDLQGATERLLRLKWDVASGAVVSPWIRQSGFRVDDPSTKRPSTTAAALIDSLRVNNYDFVKLYGVSEAEYVTYAASARRLEVAFAGHVPITMPASAAAAHGAVAIEHVWAPFDECTRPLRGAGTDSQQQLHFRSSDLSRPVDDSACERLAQVLDDRGTTLIPTINMWALAEFDEDVLPLVPPRYRPALSTRAGAVGAKVTLVERLGQMMAIFRSHGVRILPGSDHPAGGQPAGIGLLKELEAFERSGFSPAHALAAATIASARFVGASDSVGVIAPGMIADLVLLREDPLRSMANLRSVETVVVRGRVLRRDSLDLLRSRAGAAIDRLPRDSDTLVWRSR